MMILKEVEKMTSREVFLLAPVKQAFHVRLYYIRVSPEKMQNVAHFHPAIELGFFNDCWEIFAPKDKQYSIEPRDIVIFRSNEQPLVVDSWEEANIIVSMERLYAVGYLRGLALAIGYPLR